MIQILCHLECSLLSSTRRYFLSTGEYGSVLFELQIHIRVGIAGGTLPAVVSRIRLVGGLAVDGGVDRVLGHHMLLSIKGYAHSGLACDGSVLTIRNETCAAGSDGKILRRAGWIVDERPVPRFISQTVEEHRGLAVRCGNREGRRPFARLHWEFLLRR